MSERAKQAHPPVSRGERIIAGLAVHGATLNPVTQAKQLELVKAAQAAVVLAARERWFTG